MATYLRKIDRNMRTDVYDTAVSGFYSDLPEGKETTITVRAGMYNDAALFDFPIPPAPSYGAGELSGFKFEFQMDAGNVGDIEYGGPFAIYMFKEGHELGNEEGSASRVRDTTNNTFAPAAVITVHHQDESKDPQSAFVEKFTNAGPDEITYTSPGSIARASFYYMSLKDFEDQMGFGMVDYHFGGGAAAYASKHPITGADIVELEPTPDKGCDWQTVVDPNPSSMWKGKLAVYDENTWLDGRIGGTSGSKGKVKTFNPDIMNDITDEKNTFHEATTNDTFFDIINTNPNHTKPDAIKANDGDDEYHWSDSETFFHAYTGVNFSTQKALTEGMSLQMKAFMDTNKKLGVSGSRTKASTQSGGTFYDFGTGHTRQSICVAKKNIPMPVTYFDELASANKNRTSGSYETPQEIDIDVYFDELGAVYAYKPATSGTPAHHASHSDFLNQSAGYIYSHLRSFAIIFSGKLPDENQDFGDYIYSHTNGSGDKDLMDIADVTENLMGVIFYKVPASPTSANDTAIEIKTLSSHAGAGSTPTDGTDNIIIDEVTEHQAGANAFIDPNNKIVLGWGTHGTPTGYKLKEKTWYRLKFIYNVNGWNGVQNDNDGDTDSANMAMYIFDPSTNKLSTETTSGVWSDNPYVNGVMIKNCNVDATDYINLGSKWPDKLSLWVNNHQPQFFSTTHDASTWNNTETEDMFYSTAVTHDATQGTKDDFIYVPHHTCTNVYIDKITMKNQNLMHNNMGGENNPHYSSTSGVVVSNTKQMFQPSILPPNSNLNVGPTGIALGFNDRTQLNGVEKWLLFNGFTTSNPANNAALTDGNMHSAVLTNAEPSIMGDHINKEGAGTALFSNTIIGASTGGIKTGDGVLADPLQDVDGFSQKGLIRILDSAVTWDNDNDKRENLWASAKIMKAERVAGNSATIFVDDPTVLSMPHGTEFKIYKAFENNSTAAAQSVVRIHSITDNAVSVAYVSGTALGTLLIDVSDATNTISRMYISPLLYWINIMTSGGDSLPERRYQSVCLLDDDLATTAGGMGLGATYNERSFASSGGLTNYTQSRSLGADQKPVYDTEIDYGHGTHSEDETGYAKLFVPGVGYNFIDLDNVQKKRKYKPEDRFSFLIKPHNTSSVDYMMVMNSSDHATTTKRPALYAEYHDARPTIEKFKVLPNEDDAQTLDFEWEIEGDDLWYGLLFIDNKEVSSQYHNAIAHIPLDEDSTTTYLYYPDKGDKYIHRTANSSEVSGTVTATVTADREGLAGWTKAFDKDNAKIVYATGGDLTDPTDEMTLVAHCVPNYLTSTETRYIFFRDDFLKVSLESSTSGTYVKAVMENTNNDTYTLQSPYILTDGDTPVCVITTFNKNLPSNNFKLFVNGTQVDSINTDTTYNIHANNNDVIIGNISSATNGFGGQIEEVVLYNQAVEVISPSQERYSYDIPLRHGENNTTHGSNKGSPQGYMARLFVKDYHNIRGYSISEVASSSPVSITKTSFALNDT